ncbi:hypothetical protein SAMN04489844_0049 [Nocardioides exalbidus]|uniref:DUF6973 domain-containing protein n=1 Tax=Nocardioides exalbidus TaxID=402596 RepID=A0A1H4I5P6_9ACTN|nr:hypothetical protein [Nocardioides exalbidus]SEB28602.1 hypothetical protein SAMN04489844_0049 [Nocardioides exalbidus]
MGFLDTSLPAAIHAATGVPRLWTAATRAGLSASQAAEVLVVSQAALKTAAVQGKGVPGRTNAMRHFMWQAVLTARFGREAAAAIAAAQETGSPNRKDSTVDAHNNAVGQAHGEAHAAELASGSASAAVASLVPVALEKWEADELIWVKPH